MRPRRNAPGSLEDAATFLERGMGAARRGRNSLAELRANERDLLRQWAQGCGLLFIEDPTLTLDPRSSHGEQVVGFDAGAAIWWKTTHPGKSGVGVEFEYDPIPPFAIKGIFAREMLPSEYIARMILHNREF